MDSIQKKMDELEERLRILEHQVEKLLMDKSDADPFIMSPGSDEDGIVIMDPDDIDVDISTDADDIDIGEPISDQ